MAMDKPVVGQEFTFYSMLNDTQTLAFISESNLKRILEPECHQYGHKIPAILSCFMIAISDKITTIPKDVEVFRRIE
jgi:hypothetical protein